MIAFEKVFVVLVVGHTDAYISYMSLISIEVRKYWDLNGRKDGLVRHK